MRFGTDGVRGVANTELTPSFALDLGRATARVLGATCAVVGGDTRRSTPMLEAALVAGLASEGLEVHRLGVAPTPAIAYHAARLGGIGAVVSASHNLYADNGIKLFSPSGTKLPDEVEQLIEAELAVLGMPSGEPGVIVDSWAINDRGAYVEHLVEALEGRSLGGMKIVVDAANGAAFEVAGDVFTRAGAEVLLINATPDGININRECGATEPAGLARMVVEHGALAGLALDGDGDRLIAVDETGRIIDGDHVIAICAVDMRARALLRHDTVVVTVMTNLGFRLAMTAAGLDVVETAVGDRYVLEALQRGGYSLGGEQSGHVIFHDRASTGDGLATGLALLDIVARSGRTLGELAAESMTQLPQVLVNVRVSRRLPDIAELLAAEIDEAGRALGATSRILVRPSGTEPLVRVMVEAPTEELARSTADALAGLVESRYG
jgi:phosphoglucosamine mutase